MVQIDQCQKLNILILWDTNSSNVNILCKPFKTFIKHKGTENTETIPGLQKVKSYKGTTTNFLSGVQPVFILSKRLFLRDLCSILPNTIITLDVSHLDKRNFQGNKMFDLDLQTTLTISFSVKTQLVSRKLKILKLLMALYLY